MGTLANSLFRMLTGWIRVLSLEIWNVATSADRTTLMAWVGEHWKGLALLLCIIGAMIDTAVYIFRWQPYRVWRSRRNRKIRREAENLPEETAEEPEPVYDESELAPALVAQAGMNFESDPVPEAETGRSDAIRPAAPEDPYAAYRRPAARYAESAYENDADEMMSMEIPEEQPQQAEPEKPENITARFEQAIRPRRRRRMREMLSDIQETDYQAPQELIDRNEAYRQPVYPRSWLEEAGKESPERDDFLES